MCLMCYDSFDSFDSFDSKILWVFDSCERTHAERSCSLPQLLASCYKLHHSTASSLDTVVASSELSQHKSSSHMFGVVSRHIRVSIWSEASVPQTDDVRVSTSLEAVMAGKKVKVAFFWAAGCLHFVKPILSTSRACRSSASREQIDWRKYIKYAANNTR